MALLRGYRFPGSGGIPVPWKPIILRFLVVGSLLLAAAGAIYQRCGRAGCDTTLAQVYEGFIRFSSNGNGQTASVYSDGD